MKKKKKKGFTKVERFLYKSSLVIIVFLVVGIVFTSTAVSKMNIELQDMNKKVEKGGRYPHSRRGQSRAGRNPLKYALLHALFPRIRAACGGARHTPSRGECSG